MQRSTKTAKNKKPKEIADEVPCYHNAFDRNNNPIVPLRRSARIQLAAENQFLSNAPPICEFVQRTPRMKKSTANKIKNTPQTESPKSKADDCGSEGAVAAAARAERAIEAIKRMNEMYKAQQHQNKTDH